MKLKVQLVVCADDGREEQEQKVETLEKHCQRARVGSPTCLTARPPGSRPLPGAASV